MKKLFGIIIITLVSVQVFSQIDSTEMQILNYSNSKSVIISKGRSLLLDKFLENDIDKVKEIKNYLINKGNDEDYIALFTTEYWLILYWTNEYEELLNSIVQYDSVKKENDYFETSYSYDWYWTNEYDELLCSAYDVSRESYYSRICPAKDMLNTKLLAKSKENAQTLINQIQNATIDSDKQNFLQLHFESLIKKDASFQDSLNIQAEKFLTTYPETKYKDFVKKHIEYKFVPKDWGGGYDLFGGYGVFTGTLRNNYTDNFLIGGGFDVRYKRLELYLRGYVGFSKTKKDFDYSLGVYERDSKLSVTLPEASFGFAVLDTDRFKLAPFAGIGGLYIAPSGTDTKKLQELEELKISSFTYNVGLSLDIKFGEKDYAFYPKSDFGFLRIRYGYSIPNFSKKYDGISGGLHYITVGFGVFMRGVKRVY